MRDSFSFFRERCSFNKANLNTSSSMAGQSQSGPTSPPRQKLYSVIQFKSGGRIRKLHMLADKNGIATMKLSF
jgi:hypothetical protein